MVRNIFKLAKILFQKDKIDLLITHFTDPRGYPTEINTLRILKGKKISFKEICIYLNIYKET